MKFYLKILLIAAVTLLVAAYVSGTIFVVAADPNQVRLQYGGTARVRLDSSQLVLDKTDPNNFELRVRFRLDGQ